MRKLLLLIALTSVPVLAAVGCGAADQGASAASQLAPAGAVMYGEADLHPDGDQADAIDAILAKFPGGGQTGNGLEDLIDSALRSSDAPISFKKDVKPWLGDEAAFFAGVASADGQTGAAAALIATDDEDGAQAALEKSAEGRTTKHSYKDVDYLTDESGEAGAVFDGFLVLGTEAGVRAAIDTSNGGKKLSDDQDFKNAIKSAAADRLGLFYLNSPELLRAAGQNGSSLEPIVATAKAEDDGVVIEADVPDRAASAFGVLGRGSRLLTALPGDSWLALGQTDLGKLLGSYVDTLAGAGGARELIEQQFKAVTGLDLHRDVLDWMGDFGIFVRGTTVSELDGALTIETSDEEASGRFVGALERLAKTHADDPGESVGPLTAPGGGEGFTMSRPDIPKPVDVFQRDGKVVFAYGHAAAKDATDPADRLGDSADFTAARDSLGDYDPSFYVLVKPILDLVDSTSAANESGWREARPYLEPLSALVGGTSGDGDTVRSAFKLVIK